MFQDPNLLNVDEIRKIDQSNLSAMERHHVRLLAHCLQAFKTMKSNADDAKLPQKCDWIKWCNSQAKLQNDAEFVQVLLEQFSGATAQLQKLSEAKQIAPLQLTLDDLLNAYETSEIV